MDFLKEIVKEIGDEYTQIASDIDETERFIIQDPTYLMDSLVGLFLAGLAAIVLLPLLVSRALVKPISLLLSSRTFWTLTLMGIVSILTLKQPSIKDYWSLVELIRHGWLL